MRGSISVKGFSGVSLWYLSSTAAKAVRIPSSVFDTPCRAKVGRNHPKIPDSKSTSVPTTSNVSVLKSRNLISSPPGSSRGDYHGTRILTYPPFGGQEALWSATTSTTQVTPKRSVSLPNKGAHWDEASGSTTVAPRKAFPSTADLVDTPAPQGDEERILRDRHPVLSPRRGLAGPGGLPRRGHVVGHHPEPVLGGHLAEYHLVGVGGVLRCAGIGVRGDHKLTAEDGLVELERRAGFALEVQVGGSWHGLVASQSAAGRAEGERSADRVCRPPAQSDAQGYPRARGRMGRGRPRHRGRAHRREHRRGRRQILRALRAARGRRFRRSRSCLSGRVRNAG